MQNPLKSHFFLWNQALPFSLLPSSDHTKCYCALRAQININVANKCVDDVPAGSATPLNEEIMSQHDTSVSEVVRLSFPSDAIGLSNESS